MVEQDLVISRALVELFRHPRIEGRLAFRGGTALHKLHLAPASRYSEDIDLVQVEARPIGETLDAVKEALNPWLGEPKRKFKEGRCTLVYRFTSENATGAALRLKVEINTREHFTELGYRSAEWEVDSEWFTGRASIPTYELDELLGTKLRALYQRKKGRDLFDLAVGLNAGADPERVVRCFLRYMAEAGHQISRALLEENLTQKQSDPAFLADISPLVRQGREYSVESAFEQVMTELVALVPGEPWKGLAG